MSYTETYYTTQLQHAHSELRNARRKYEGVKEPRFASDFKAGLRAEVDRWEREVKKWSDRLAKIQEG